MLTWARTKCFDSTYNVQNLIYLELFCLVWNHIPCSGKLVREKSSTNFGVLWLFAKFGGVTTSLVEQRRAIRESFLRENHIFYQFVNVFSFDGTGIT